MGKILITDDNRAFAENLAEVLEDAGHETRIAGSGAEALEIASSTRFDVLLSDMRMPAMGGAELVHRVRRLDPGLPAVVITAYAWDNDIEMARQDGLLAILTKPVSMPLLLELIEKARRAGLVVLIEDNAELADNLTEVLRGHGFAAVTAASVLETERLGSIAPTLALVDLRVPGGPDGEAMRKLAQRFPGLPMLVITAHSDVSPPIAPAGYFAKPFAMPSLLEAVERLYKAHQSH